MSESLSKALEAHETRAIEVLVIQPLTDADLARIAAVDPRVRVTDARGWFDEEIKESRPARTVERYFQNRKSPPSSRQQRDELLAKAEVIFGGWPPPLDFRSRAPRLRWFHQRPAGASNLVNTDLWKSDVLVTTSRGYASARPIAEYALACLMHFARGLHFAYRDQRAHRFDHATYRPLLMTGKTACVIGTGGIGSQVGELCAGIGMRVVGLRRHVRPGAPLPRGFSRIEGPERLHDLLGESDFVAVCCQWTAETNKMINAAAFAAMRPGTILVNVARGEIVDEEALVEALEAGKLRGVGLDVFVGEMEHLPDPRLWDNERVLITPHISGGTDVPQHGGVDLFCENLKAYLKGSPLSNVIDWERGY